MVAMIEFGDARLRPKFWAKVAPNSETGCWVWTASLRRSGYGRYGNKANQRAAHRVSYEAMVGPIPDGMQIDHLCRVPNCVNPAHLEPVTHLENVRRAIAARTSPEEVARTLALQESLALAASGAGANSLKTHCPKGHEYTGDNLYVRPGRCRECNTCRRDIARQHMAELRRSRKQGSPTNQKEGG